MVQAPPLPGCCHPSSQVPFPRALANSLPAPSGSPSQGSPSHPIDPPQPSAGWNALLFCLPPACHSGISSDIASSEALPDHLLPCTPCHSSPAVPHGALSGWLHSPNEHLKPFTHLLYFSDRSRECKFTKTQPRFSVICGPCQGFGKGKKKKKNSEGGREKREGTRKDRRVLGSNSGFGELGKIL